VYFVGTIIRAAAIYSSHLLEKIEINSSVFQSLLFQNYKGAPYEIRGSDSGFRKVASLLGFQAVSAGTWWLLLGMFNFE
jgi:hypothetical protein